MGGKRGDRIRARHELRNVVAALEAMPPWERVVGAARIIEDLRVCQAALAAMRRESISEMHREGLSFGDIAQLIGTSQPHAFMLGTDRYNARKVRTNGALGVEKSPPSERSVGRILG